VSGHSPNAFALSIMEVCLTKEEAHKDVVETNMKNCQCVILAAETANKGRYSHDINRWMAQLKPMIKAMKGKKPENVSIEDLASACKIAQNIGYDLFLLSQGR